MSPGRKLTDGCRAVTFFLHTVALLQSHVCGNLNLRSTDQPGRDCHCFLSAGGDHGAT